MSSEFTGPEFWERADAIINIANKQCDSATSGKVSSSLLYAASRFNAFIVASGSTSLEELKNDKEDAIKYFTEQYKKMLIENLDDYIENYETYIAT